MRLRWTDYRLIGEKLYDLDGDSHPLEVRFSDLRQRVLDLQGFDVVVEGGAVESDGAGTLLTTESCLLNDNRNRGKSREDLDAEQEKAIRDKLEEAVRAGHEVLASGGAGLQAVTAAVNILEDSPLFNAGKGSVFTHDGKNELDASVMAGEKMSAGAVAGVSHVRNPISLAIQVMQRSDHVMLAGRGAEAFARAIGMPLVEPDYFYTERRWRQLQRVHHLWG